MAKSFDERFAAMLKASSRATDVEDMIAEIGNMISQVEADSKEARAFSLDPLTSIPEAKAARAALVDADFAIERLNAQRELLRDRLIKLTESAKANALMSDYNAAVSETETLKADIAERYPRLCDELSALFSRIKKNDETVRLVNANRPGRTEAIVPAEAAARGFLPHGMWPDNVNRVQRLTDIKLPRFAGWGELWPVAKSSAADIHEAAARQLISERKRASADADILIEREKQKARFRVKRSGWNETRSPVLHAAGVIYLMNETAVQDFYPDQIAAARAEGFTVDSVSADHRLGVVEPREG